MKTLTPGILSLLLLVTAGESHARLGDTRDQLEARYGLPKSETPSRPPLLEGSREVTFQQPQWTIRCALLLAKDGRNYVVRQNYQKRPARSTVGSSTNTEVSDHERDWLLKTEAGARTWIKRISADHGDTLQESLIKRFLLPREWNLGTVWLREGGATARVEGLNQAIVFDLPQARKYEAELRAMKEAKAAARSLGGLQELERKPLPPDATSIP